MSISQITFNRNNKNYKFAINFLAYQLIQYYTKKGIKILDIGISTEDGIPNYGLCDFKESIGCFLSSKIIFTEYND